MKQLPAANLGLPEVLKVWAGALVRAEARVQFCWWPCSFAEDAAVATAKDKTV
ncbi:MAG: hypothetical protein ACP5R4_03135 [Armatimonadota bacterium]